ncbi:hypothetical protein [Pseudochelatococcus contaminans]|uniref:Uncharacterized protein n=1 Tax=Pseudochelatococcus contaminans TaxID=1538103 RepID=A0A7W5Z6A6_9HYPH|nr:hypothetical protein [Pseudochelatococcus contaminans]MBB3810489.1 hypothetical protein [Pseudochelatococcus contaminans]
MAPTETVTAAAAPRREVSGSYIDWAAVLGGAVVSAAIVGLFAAFGTALGLSTISAVPGEGSFNLWIIVTALWLVISVVASYLAGGYVAGRMRRRVDDAPADEVSTRDGINGLVVWGLGMLVTAWMAAGAISGAASAVGTAATAAGSAIGGVVQGAGAVAGGAVQGVAQTLGAAVPDDTDGGVLDYINSTLLRPAAEGVRQGVQQPDGTVAPGTPSLNDAELARQSGVVLGNVLRTGEISDQDRAFLVAAAARRTGQSEAEVNARVDQAVTAVQEARRNADAAIAEARAEAERVAKEAEEAAIAAAETARKSAILTAFLLTAAALVAGAAAVAGAVRGGRDRDEGRIWGGLSYRL